MSEPTILLVHGAFAESASWNGVIKSLFEKSVKSTAVANPLRSVTGDGAYLRDVIESIDGPVLLVAHSYGGFVITEAGSHPSVKGLVYVAAFAPDSGETAFDLSTKFEGSTLGAALDAPRPLADGGAELSIRRDVFRAQFAADVDVQVAGLMGATQRPVTQLALTEPLPTTTPAWKTVPSWFVYAEQDLNIPAELQRFQAERSQARSAREVAGASHALTVSQPEIVAGTILEALEAIRSESVDAAA
jgi:pimeloyl-ACP methyl ester carboxylesterase